jgi:raffinose/stachyose/melibiose transport system permease protein
VTPPRGRARGRRLKWHIVPFLAPAVAVYTLFIVYPLFGSARLSLFSVDPSGAQTFAGIANFERLFGDPAWSGPFWRAAGHTAELFAIHMLVQNTIGLGLALLLTSRRLRGRALMRGIIFAPSVLSIVIVGFIWQLLLNPLWGVAPSVLGIFGLEQLYQPWLGEDGPALVTLSLMSCWQYVGIPMLLFSAALLSIPEELIEAARTDGAGAFRIFRSIQFPLVLPTVGIVALLTFVGNVRAFDLIFSVQGAIAGPNYSTDLIGTLFYRTFFGIFTSVPNPAMGATIATATLGFVAVVVCIYFFGLQRRLRRFDA